MCTIKLYDVMEGKDFPMAGSSLYDIIRENMKFFGQDYHRYGRCVFFAFYVFKCFNW